MKNTDDFFSEYGIQKEISIDTDVNYFVVDNKQETSGKSFDYGIGTVVYEPQTLDVPDMSDTLKKLEAGAKIQNTSQAQQSRNVQHRQQSGQSRPPIKEYKPQVRQEKSDVTQEQAWQQQMKQQMKQQQVLQRETIQRQINGYNKQESYRQGNESPQPYAQQQAQQSQGQPQYTQQQYAQYTSAMYARQKMRSEAKKGVDNSTKLSMGVIFAIIIIIIVVGSLIFDSVQNDYGYNYEYEYDYNYYYPD